MKFLIFWTAVVALMTLLKVETLTFDSWLCGIITGVLIADWILYFENGR